MAGVPAPARPYRVVIANGPPDTETFDRRRVDPPAGCRAAGEPAHCLDGGPSTMTPRKRRPSPSGGGRFVRASVREATARHVPALVAQEPFDVGDQVIAGREALLVIHRLEPLDVGVRRVIRRRGGVETRPELARFLGQLAGRDLGPEMRAERAEKLERGRRVWPGHVV